MHPFVRLAGIICVFVLAAIGWLILGGVTSSRSTDQRSTLDGRVADLWGSPQTQSAPAFELRWAEQETKTEQFSEGYTGVSITVLVILTLFLLMQLTGRLSWSSVFARA